MRLSLKRAQKKNWFYDETQTKRRNRQTKYGILTNIGSFVYLRNVNRHRLPNKNWGKCVIHKLTFIYLFIYFTRKQVN